MNGKFEVIVQNCMLEIHNENKKQIVKTNIEIDQGGTVVEKGCV